MGFSILNFATSASLRLCERNLELS